MFYSEDIERKRPQVNKSLEFSVTLITICSQQCQPKDIENRHGSLQSGQDSLQECTRGISVEALCDNVKAHVGWVDSL